MTVDALKPSREKHSKTYQVYAVKDGGSKVIKNKPDLENLLLLVGASLKKAFVQGGVINVSFSEEDKWGIEESTMELVVNFPRLEPGQ
jgi:hypothetical protein